MGFCFRSPKHFREDAKSLERLLFTLVVVALCSGCAPTSVRTNRDLARQWTEADTSLSGRFVDVNVTPTVQAGGISISVDGVAICQVEQTDWVQFQQNTVREADSTLLIELFGTGAGLVVVGAILLSVDEETAVDGTVTDTSAAADLGLALTLAGVVPLGFGIGSAIRAVDDHQLTTPTIRNQTVTDERCGPRVPATEIVVTLVADDDSVLDSARTNRFGQAFIAPELHEMGALRIWEMANLEIHAGDAQVPFDLSDWSPYTFARTQWLLNSDNSPTLSDLAEFIEHYPSHPHVDTFSTLHEDLLWRYTLSGTDSGDPEMYVEFFSDYLAVCILCEHIDEAEEGLAEAQAELERTALAEDDARWAEVTEYLAVADDNPQALERALAQVRAYLDGCVSRQCQHTPEAARAEQRINSALEEARLAQQAELERLALYTFSGPFEAGYLQSTHRGFTLGERARNTDEAFEAICAGEVHRTDENMVDGEYTIFECPVRLFSRQLTFRVGVLDNEVESIGYHITGHYYTVVEWTGQIYDFLLEQGGYPYDIIESGRYAMVTWRTRCSDGSLGYLWFSSDPYGSMRRSIDHMLNDIGYQTEVHSDEGYATFFWNCGM